MWQLTGMENGVASDRCRNRNHGNPEEHSSIDGVTKMNNQVLARMWRDRTLPLGHCQRQADQQTQGKHLSFTAVSDPTALCCCEHTHPVANENTCDDIFCKNQDPEKAQGINKFYMVLWMSLCTNLNKWISTIISNISEYGKMNPYN